MNNTILQLKVKQRLNKLASNDMDNIECWMIIEAFNKGQAQWCRRNLHGINILQEGDEESTRRIDDLQRLIASQPITVSKKDKYYETANLPANYFEWKRITITGSNDCCEDRAFVTYLAEEANVDELLRDYNKKPSFEWGETFATLINNKVRIYTNNEFDVTKAQLTFYREPLRIQVENCQDPYTQVLSTVNVECEFPDDLVEVLIDEAVMILAGDIESFNQVSIAKQSVENNN